MSYDIRQIESTRDTIADDAQTMVSLTSFFGGEEDGRCLQLTVGREYVGLTEGDARRLLTALAVWLDPDINGPMAAKIFEMVET
jgi:hypothetical protein